MRLACVALFMLVLSGCHAPVASTGPTEVAATAIPTLASQGPAATGLTAVWGEVPKQCAWHVEPLARVATDLQDAQLPVDFKLEKATEGWQLFSITFDPARVSSEQIRQILKNDGALIIPAPVGG